jgi:ABC-2 type transport system ATP-binding protein
MTLDSDLSGEQYLKFVNSRYHKKSMANANFLADLLKIDLKTKISKLSSGNRQKIGLISALMHNPKLLILDEPTQGFDPLVQQIFIKLIKTFKKKGGTVFMSSHILEEVQELCDRVCFIKEGSIIGVKDVKEITSSARKKIIIKADPKALEKIKHQHNSLPGLNLINQSDDFMELGFSGDVNKLIDYLSVHKIDDLTIKEPELEEIFIDLYKPTKSGNTES